MAPVQVIVSTSPVHLDSEMARLVSRAQELLGYELRSDDPKEVIRRSLRLLVEKLERRKAPRHRVRRSRGTENPRYIPQSVMNAVWNRDRGRCTFVGDSGHVCGSCEHLQFDHILPVARGGESMVANLRLRCRAHNQFEAERAFGSEFMEHKRTQARERAAAKREEDESDVIPWLRQLGFRMDQAKRAAAHCDRLEIASLEDRVRAALKFLAPPHRRLVPA